MSVQRAKENIKQMIEQGAPESDIDAYLKIEGLTIEDLKSKPIDFPVNLDSKTGAPALVRSVVGPSSRKASDRLATLQKTYPSAKHFRGDNFIYNDPRTNRPTLFNPPGLDAGDLAQEGRMGAEMLGGFVGGTAGMAGGPSAPLTVPLGVGLGAEGFGQIYDKGLEYLSGRVNTQTLPEQSAQASTGVMMNTIGQKLGAELPGALKNIYAGGRNRMAGATGPQLTYDFKKAGIPLEGSAGAITGSRSVQGTTNALAQLPSSATTMGSAADKTFDGINRYANQVIGQFGRPLTPQGAGEIAIKAAKKAGGRFKNRREFLDDSVVKLVGENTPADIQPVRNLISKMTIQAKKNPKTSGYLNKAMLEAQKVIDDAESGNLTFDALRKFRTDLGGKLDASTTATGYVGQEKSGIKQVYGAVKQSLLNTAKSKSKEAEKALKLHDRYTGFNLKTNLPDLDDLVKKDADNAYKFVMNRAKDGGAKLARLKRNFQPEEWDTIAATTLQEMGKGTPGSSGVDDAFSTSRFLTNWNKLSPEAKRIAFGGKRYRPLKDNLDRLVRVSAASKDVSSMKNFSNTAQQHIYMAMLMGGGLGGGAGYALGGEEGAALGVAAPLILPYAASKLMTNPKFVGWLAKGVEINPLNYNSINSHLGRLATIVSTEDDIKDEVNQYINAFRSE